MTLAAQADGYILLPHEQHIVGGMWGMAANAITCSDGFAQAFIFGVFYGPLLQLHRILVTAAANVELGVI